MTTFRQKLAGVTVLGIVSGVSLLAGGIMLGGVSADDGTEASPDKPVFNFKAGGEPGNVRVLSAVVNGEGSCYVAYGGEGDIDPAKLSAGVPFSIARAGGTDEVRAAVAGSAMKVEKGLKMASPDKLKDAPAEFLTRAVEAKPISPEEIERLKASGELKVFAPEDCKVVTPEELEDLAPGDLKKAP